MSYFGNIREEELKLKVGEMFFSCLKGQRQKNGTSRWEGTENENRPGT